MTDADSVRVIDPSTEGVAVPSATDSPPPRLVGICGMKYAGKTTAAQAFVRQGYAERTFADPMRTCVQTMFNLTDAECTDPKLKEKPGVMGVSYRRGMQVFGTDFVRGMLSGMLPELKCDGPQFWIEHMRIAVNQLHAKEVNVVVSDVRFLDEAEYILDNGGVLLFIHRPDRDAASLTGGWTSGEMLKDAHPSEQGPIRIFKKLFGGNAHPRAVTIVNSTSKEELGEAALLGAALANNRR